MSQTSQLSRTSLLAPSRLAPGDPRQQGITCPFGANCSCKFSRTQSVTPELTPEIAPELGVADVEKADIEETDVEDLRAALSAEVTGWIRRGWKVVASTSREVTLERQRTQSFCLNVAVTLLTGLLWLAYWIPNARHPKIDTWTVLVSDNGDITRTQGVSRRR